MMKKNIVRDKVTTNCGPVMLLMSRFCLKLKGPFSLRLSSFMTILLLSGHLPVLRGWPRFKCISRRGRRGNTFNVARKWCRVLPVLQHPFLQILQTTFSSLVRRAVCGVCVCACDVLAYVCDGKCEQAWNSPWSDFDTRSAAVAWKCSVLIHY